MGFIDLISEYAVKEQSLKMESYQWKKGMKERRNQKEKESRVREGERERRGEKEQDSIITKRNKNDDGYLWLDGKQ